MRPVPEASYCDACGVLLVHEATHLRLRVHRAKSGGAPAVMSTPAVPPGPGLQPALSTASVQAVVVALITGSSLKSAIAAAVSAALPRPQAPAETPPNEDTGAPDDLVDGMDLDLSFFGVGGCCHYGVFRAASVLGDGDVGIESALLLGYGNIAPKTNLGKIVTILYAIVGIPLMLLYLTNIGDILAKAFKYVYRRLCSCDHRGGGDGRRAQAAALYYVSSTRKTAGAAGAMHCRVNHIAFEEGLLPGEVINGFADQTRQNAMLNSYMDQFLDDLEERPRVTVPILLCMTIIGSYICGGAVLFSVWEDWNYLDGSYFCFVTLSTIGFGDLVPGDTVVSDSGSQEKLVICSLYLLVGLALIAMCFNLVQEEVVLKIRALGRRFGMVNDSDVDSDSE
nr:potassium channel subfamily K member 18-like [Rhipicephalus microplus]